MSARGLVAALLILLLAAGTFFIYPRFEKAAPTIEAAEQVTLGQEPLPFSIALGDLESGLRSISVRLQTAGGTKELHEEFYPGSPFTGGEPARRDTTVEFLLDPEELQLPDGPATLIVAVRDWSLRDGMKGNYAEQSIALQVDTRPPSIAVSSGLTYVSRGGSGAAIYSLDEATRRDGILVGETFFPGYSLGAGSDGGKRRQRIALFAIPVEAPTDPPVRAVATDLAGNQSSASFPARVSEKRFHDSTIALSPRFLSQVAVPLASENGLSDSDPIAAFKMVNEELRARNEAKIQEVVAASTAKALWQGTFAQLANSKVTSRFAEFRTYTSEGRAVSNARHYGFDLASTSGAPITASNTGVVLFADSLGIYGNCVILDHGLGLTSLYAHLSRIDVSEGQTVAKNDQVGLSGATGLAGGDHLHFAILVGNTYVDPMEWWDPRWVESHIAVRMSPAAP